MVDNSKENPGLTEAAKVSLANSGLLPNLKNLLYKETAAATNSDADGLKEKGQAVIEDLQKLIESGKLPDADLQKLTAVLSRLKGALQGGLISPNALAMAISEATSAMSTADLSGKIIAQEQKIEQLWRQIEQHNKDIDDDFEKMRKSGIIFDEKLWSKHKELSEFLKAHPHDIEHQKELNAVDDLLLKQSEPQLKHCPDAKPYFDDAEKKSKERHKEVAEVAAIQSERKEKRPDFANDDWGMQNDQVTMNDVRPPIVMKQKSESNKASLPAK